jgi:regulator of replication initiation timing
LLPPSPQLQDLQLHLEREIGEKEKLQTKNHRLQNELAELERLKKALRKLELAKDKLESEYRAYKVFSPAITHGA